MIVVKVWFHATLFFFLVRFIIFLLNLKLCPFKFILNLFKILKIFFFMLFIFFFIFFFALINNILIISYKIKLLYSLLLTLLKTRLLFVLLFFRF